VRIAAGLIAGALVVTGCASTEDRLVTAFVESNPVADAEEARCVVDELVSSYGADGVTDELQADSPSAGFLDNQGRAMAKCDVVVNTDEDLARAFMEANPDVSVVEASCVIDTLTEAIGTSELIATLWLAETPREFEVAQFKAMFACGIDRDVRSALTQQLLARGTPEDKAPCVADDIVNKMDLQELDVLISGENTDEFYAKYFNAMEGCGALNSN
jgi:hypothetical protein